MKLIRRRRPSWKTALGITKAKRNFARMTGIPTTKAGRKRKTLNMMTGGAYGRYQRTRAKVLRPFKYHKSPHSCLGCLVSLLLPVLLFGALIVFTVVSIADAEGTLALWQEDWEEARGLANFLQEHYGVTVLLGEECEGLAPKDVSFGSKTAGRTPLLDLLAEPTYLQDVRLLDDCFSVYSPGYFSCFRCPAAEQGLRILLPLQLLRDGQTMAGTVALRDGYLDLILGLGAFASLNVHHELWHAMELRLLEEDPELFAAWNELNPKDFRYDPTILEADVWQQNEPGGDYFVREYGRISPEEDRATVIEALFIFDGEWWEEHPCLRAKLDVLLSAAVPVFGNVYFHQ